MSFMIILIYTGVRVGELLNKALNAVIDGFINNNKESIINYLLNNN